MIVLAMCLAAAGGVLGCSGTTLLNPDFLSALGFGGAAANIPGDAPSLLVEVENRTDRVVETLVSWRDGDSNVHARSIRLTAGTRRGEALICPIEEVTLGDVSALSRTGAIVRLGNGTNQDAFIEVEPFGILLQDGVNYDCGDAVTFAVVNSGETASGYQIFAFIQRAPQ
jgi:hypothetical protein